MIMVDIIFLVLLLAFISFLTFRIFKNQLFPEKKNSSKCSGCSFSGMCSKKILK